MDIIRGALPRTRRNDHEQDHPHPKAQRAALLCGGAGVRGTVRGAAGIQIMGAAGGAGRLNTFKRVLQYKCLNVSLNGSF